MSEAAPTYNQINEQKSSAYMSRSNADPTVLVQRTDGRVTVGRLNRDTRDVHFSESGIRLMKEVSIESLTDDRQALLAEELAGRALRGSETDLLTSPVQEQEQPIDPVEQLPPDVKDDVRAYRRALQNKRESEQEKNFAQAAEDGRILYRVKQSLSSEAQQFLGIN